MDPLSHVLGLVTVRSALSSRLEAGGSWSLTFPGARHLKFGAVERGSTWMAAEGAPPRLLRSGDCFVLATRGPYTVTADPALPAQDGLAVFRAATDGTARVGDGTGVAVSGGRFVLDESSAHLLLDVLPPLLVVRADDAGAPALRATLALFLGEVRRPRRLGHHLVAHHLGRLVLLEALRTAVESGEPTLRGWLAALADDRVAAALAAVHAEPGRAWTVPELAATAHMSRSAFAARFRALVGASPVDYALTLRMLVAGRMLQHPDATVSSVGVRVGYGSDAAFSSAFKRVMGASPRAWRSRPLPAGPVVDDTDAA